MVRASAAGTPWLSELMSRCIICRPQDRSGCGPLSVIDCLNRFDARDTTSVVDGVAAVGEIEQDKRVAERVSDDRQATNCDFVRLHHDDAARGRDVGYCIRDRGDQPVRGVRQVLAEHDLGFAVR